MLEKNQISSINSNPITQKINFLESAIVLYDSQIVAVSRGTPASVEFDFEKVWEFKRTIKNFNPMLLSWFHVHPFGFGSKSSHQDLICAQSLKLAFGKLGMFAILCFDDNNLENINGNISFYEFREEQYLSEDEPSDRIEDYFKHNRTEVPYILKALSIT